MLKGASSDASCHSKMCFFLPDPMAVSNTTGSRQKAKKDSTYTKDFEGKGVILPSTKDCVTGRRTELKLDISEQLPSESLVFLKSTFNTSPDVLQMIVRSVENDLKLHVDSLVSSNDSTAIGRLECKKTERTVKPPRFKFEKVDKFCKAVSLSFRDAEVIISDFTSSRDFGRLIIHSSK